MFLSIHANAEIKEKKPNVIFILADDMGYGDMGCYGATQIKTPNIDALANNGVRFTNAYAPASTSSPTRYALLTGEYAWRKNVGILPADAKLTIDTTIYTLPKLLKEAGYKTGLVGKWHLGLGTQETPVDFNAQIVPGPMEIGFDYAFYFPATNDRVPCVYIENHQVVKNDQKDILVSYSHKVGDTPTGKECPDLLTLKPFSGHDGTIVNGISRIGWMKGGHEALWTDENMADEILNKAVDYIEQQTADEPFFLFYSPHNAHEPRVAGEKFRGKSRAGIYGDVIEEFDYSVGQIVKVLRDKGLFDNSLIIITSDNGPRVKEGYEDGALENLNHHDPFNGLRGIKGSLHEGGTRMPFIVSWPARNKAPFIQKQPFCYMDMLASMPGIIGMQQPQVKLNDSHNASELFCNENASIYREYIMIQNNSGRVALRMGDWKYIPSENPDKAELYNLANDYMEQHNRISEEREVIRKMDYFYQRDYKSQKE